MKFNPHQYQRRGIEWIKAHKRCALFWEMGLGKSVTTLTAMADLYDDCAIEKVLVVAPKKVAESTWSTETSKWDHLSWMKVSKVMGTEKQRVAALQAEAEIYVIGRDSVVWLLGYYNGDIPFDMIVLDELTSFKSAKSQRFKAMRLMSAKASRVIGLTGTPTPNGLVDLWAQLYCIDLGERLGKSVTRYRDEHFDQRRWNNIVVKTTIKKGHDRLIRDKIADICLTMQASDYLQLPKMIEHTEHVALPDNVRAGYEEFEREKVLEFESEHQGENTTIMAASAAALMNKLSQYANGAVYDTDGIPHEIHDAKLQRLVELVEAVEGESVLVFYQYKHDVPRIQAALKAYKTRVYTDAHDLEDWNAGRIDVLLAHPASTAYGLNMQQGGHYIVWFGTGWNLELYQQANARLHRQGQTKPVFVYNLICTGTVDERAAAAIAGKADVQQSLMDGLKTLIEKYT